MVDDQKRETIKKYFRSESNQVLAIILIVIGLPLLAVAFIGVVPIAIGIYLLMKGGKYNDDQQIDKWMEEDFQSHDYVARAKELSTFDGLVREPVLLRTGRPEMVGSEMIEGQRVGEDGVWRRSLTGASVLLCNDEQLGIYQTGLDALTGNRVGERFLEVFYQEVTSIEIVKETDTVDLKDMMRNVKTANFSSSDKSMGLNRGVMTRHLEALKRRFAQFIVADILQRESATVFRIRFADGRDIAFPIVDRRATVVANRETIVDPSAEDVSAQMLTFREFVRDMKRRQITKVESGAGSLI